MKPSIRLFIIILIYFVLLYIPQLFRLSHESRVWCDGCGVEVGVRALQTPQKRGKGYLLEHRGLPIECSSSEPSCRKLDMVLPGDQIEFSGTIGEGVIGNSKNQKSLINTKIIQVHLVEPKPVISWWWWVRNLAWISDRIVLLYASLLPQPHAGLLAGIVLGIKSSVPEEFYDSLVATGTLHIIAASGFNVAFVGALLLHIATVFLHRKAAVAVSIFGIIAYAILAGGGPAVTRAAIMGGLAFGAQGLGREYWARWGLALTVLLMLMISPWLWESISFQLSVAATAGILWGEKPIRRLVKIPGKKIAESLSRDLSTTLAATLTTLPIAVVNFGQTSWISPLVNVLVLWLVPPLMILGGLIAGMGLPVPILGQALAFLAYPLLQVFIILVSWFGSLPGIKLEVGGNWWLALGWWIILLAWWGGSEKHE